MVTTGTSTVDVDTLARPYDTLEGNPWELTAAELFSNARLRGGLDERGRWHHDGCAHAPANLYFEMGYNVYPTIGACCDTDDLRVVAEQPGNAVGHYRTAVHLIRRVGWLREDFARDAGAGRFRWRDTFETIGKVLTDHAQLQRVTPLPDRVVADVNRHVAELSVALADVTSVQSRHRHLAAETVAGPDQDTMIGALAVALHTSGLRMDAACDAAGLIWDDLTCYMLKGWPLDSLAHMRIEDALDELGLIPDDVDSVEADKVRTQVEEAAARATESLRGTLDGIAERIVRQPRHFVEAPLEHVDRIHPLAALVLADDLGALTRKGVLTVPEQAVEHLRDKHRMRSFGPVPRWYEQLAQARAAELLAAAQMMSAEKTTAGFQTALHAAADVLNVDTSGS